MHQYPRVSVHIVSMVFLCSSHLLRSWKDFYKEGASREVFVYMICKFAWSKLKYVFGEFSNSIESPPVAVLPVEFQVLYLYCIKDCGVIPTTCTSSFASPAVLH